MLRRLSYFCNQGNEEYQLIARDIAVASPQDNTKLFNQIPCEILIMIITKLSAKDLTPFLLTNKKLFSLFEDFQGNRRLGALRVRMDVELNNSYQGAMVEMNYRDVNHVLMAQYTMKIVRQDLEERSNKIKREDCKRGCLVFGISATLGAVIGLAIHVGAGVLLDKVVLPSCYKCQVTNSASQTANCCCGGNVLTAADQVIIGRYFDPHVGRVIPSIVSRCTYQFCNIGLVYIPAPLIPSCAAGLGVGCLPSYNRFRDGMLGPGYGMRHYPLEWQISKIDLMRKPTMLEMQQINEKLRVKKLGGITHRLFMPIAENKALEKTESPLFDSFGLSEDENFTPLTLKME